MSTKIDPTKLVDAKGLLEALFAPDIRPGIRWVRTQQKNRTIPFIKFGHFVLFDVAKVRESLEKRNLVKPRL